MIAIAALGVFYEWLRAYQGVVDRRIAARLLASGKGKARSVSGRSTPEIESSEHVGLLGGIRGYKATCVILST
jgi:solute carrier family 31 (copper transporter), member 1